MTGNPVYTEMEPNKDEGVFRLLHHVPSSGIGNLVKGVVSENPLKTHPSPVSSSRPNVFERLDWVDI